MTLDEYIKSVKVLESEIDDISKWVEVIKIVKNVDASTFTLQVFNNIITELSNEMNIEEIEVVEKNEILINDEIFKVDTTVMGANVAFFKDYNDILKFHKGINQLKMVLCLLIYKEGENEEYSYERLEANKQRIGDMDLKEAISVVRFFFLLLKYCTDLSQISLEIETQKKNLMEIVESTVL